MSETAIQAALDATLADLSLTYVAWDNITFDSKSVPAKSAWYRPSFIPGRPFYTGIGAGAKTRFTGFYQVDIFGPPGVGIGLIRVLADAIQDQFPLGEAIAGNGVTVKVDRCYRKQGRIDTETGRYHIPVMIEWRADM